MGKFRERVKRIERALGGGESGPCPHCRDAWYQAWLVRAGEDPGPEPEPGEPCPVCGKPPTIWQVILRPADRRCPECGTPYNSRGGTLPCPKCG